MWKMVENDYCHKYRGADIEKYSWGGKEGGMKTLRGGKNKNVNANHNHIRLKKPPNEDILNEKCYIGVANEQRN